MRRSRRIVSLVGECLVTAGALVLLFVVWQVWWTDLAAQEQSAQASDGLVRQWEDAPVFEEPRSVLPSDPGSPAGAEPAASNAPPPTVAAPARGTAFALLRIPAFGSDYVQPLLEGTDTQTLKSGVGHYAGTALPGEVGNVGLAGHRVTYGRPFFRIDELRAGDVVQIETQQALLEYTVRSSLIVAPDRIDVIAPVPESAGMDAQERLLTLTACHPKYSARQRYVVHAVLSSWETKSDDAQNAQAGTGPAEAVQ